MSCWTDEILKASKNEVNSQIAFIKLLLKGYQQKNYLEAGYSSLFTFMTRHLGFSDGSAGRRNRAVKIFDKFPRVFYAYCRHAFPLDHVALVSNLITYDNLEQVLDKLCQLHSTYQLKEWLALQSNQPIGPTRTMIKAISVPVFDDKKQTPTTPTTYKSSDLDSNKNDQIENLKVGHEKVHQIGDRTAIKPEGQMGLFTELYAENNSSMSNTSIKQINQNVLSQPFQSQANQAGPKKHETTVEQKNQNEQSIQQPINNQNIKQPERTLAYRLSITLTQEQKDKLDRAKEILSNCYPKGVGVEDIIDAALETLLEKKDPIRKAARAQKLKEKKEHNKTTSDPKVSDYHKTIQSTNLTNPQMKEVYAKEEYDKKEHNKTTSDPKVNNSHKRSPIPSKLKQAVLARDGYQCTYISTTGVRCECRSYLHLDHKLPVSLGGQNEINNLTTLCNAHNQYQADRILGVEFMNIKRNSLSATGASNSL